LPFPLPLPFPLRFDFGDFEPARDWPSPVSFIDMMALLAPLALDPRERS